MVMPQIVNGYRADAIMLSDFGQNKFNNLTSMLLFHLSSLKPSKAAHKDTKAKLLFTFPFHFSSLRLDFQLVHAANNTGSMVLLVDCFPLLFLR